MTTLPLKDPFKLTYFTAHSGALSVRLDKEDGTSLHLHSLVDPEKETDYFADLQLWGDRIVLAGCGLGYHLQRALTSVRCDAAMLLVDYYEELAHRTLESFPASLREKVTIVSSGNGCPEEQVRAFLRGGHYVQIVKHPPSFHAHEDFYRSVLQLLSRKQPLSKPPAAMMLMQGDFFAERELQRAAEKHGTTVLPFLYKKWESMDCYESQLQRLIQTGRPEIIISVNMLGFDGNGILAEHARREGIPAAVWFLDDPRPILLNRRNQITPDMVAFSWERGYIPWLQRQGFSSVHYLPLATDPSRFAPPTSGGNRIRCGFTGSSMGGRFLSDIAATFIWKPHYRALAEEVAAQLLFNKQIEVDQCIAETCRSKMIPPPEHDEHTQTWLRSYILHTASMMKRKKCISSLLPSGVETFGDPAGWQELCGPGLITHPDIDYLTNLAGCYRSIIVNVNITSCQMPSGLNQRVFDVPACGAFLLNDYQDDLDELFTKNEYAVYDSPEELPEKVAFYLKNKQIRESVIASARKRILNDHTYFHRLRTLFTSL
ncbi:MAG: glycosyltransferase [Chitinispirillaceae bacterium]|nr:glycosyltransferase [Chitinispirillaceae bacterium]